MRVTRNMLTASLGATASARELCLDNPMRACERASERCERGERARRASEAGERGGRGEAARTMLAFCWSVLFFKVYVWRKRPAVPDVPAVTWHCSIQWAVILRLS